MRQGILLGERRTSLFNRFVARAIDMLVAIAILFLGKAFWPPVGILAACFFCAFSDGLGEGQSLGKRILGLRTTDAGASAPCEFLPSAVRNFPFVVAVLFLSSPGLWAFFLFFGIPLVGLEIYLLLAVDSGVRLGDVLANTQVEELGDNAMQHLT